MISIGVPPEIPPGFRNISLNYCHSFHTYQDSSWRIPEETSVDIHEIPLKFLERISGRNPESKSEISRGTTREIPAETKGSISGVTLRETLGGNTIDCWRNAVWNPRMISERNPGRSYRKHSGWNCWRNSNRIPDNTLEGSPRDTKEKSWEKLREDSRKELWKKNTEKTSGREPEMNSKGQNQEPIWEVLL